MKEVERERHHRIKSLMDGRGLSSSGQNQMRDSTVSEDMLGMNTERLLEEQFNKEEQLN